MSELQDFLQEPENAAIITGLDRLGLWSPEYFLWRHRAVKELIGNALLYLETMPDVTRATIVSVGAFIVRLVHDAIVPEVGDRCPYCRIRLKEPA